MCTCRVGLTEFDFHEEFRTTAVAKQGSLVIALMQSGGHVKQKMRFGRDLRMPKIHDRTYSLTVEDTRAAPKNH